MNFSENLSCAEPTERAVDPYRGVPLGVEGAWWPTVIGAVRHEACESASDAAPQLTGVDGHEPQAKPVY
jgi:hypothetical protein